MSVWRKAAQRRIAELVQDLPADASLEQRRKALWGKGYPAHLGTVWGRKMWGEEVRKYLARHGGPARPSRQPAFNWPDHVHFPFREPVIVGVDMGRVDGDFTVEAIVQDGRVVDFTIRKPGGSDV